MMKQKVAPDSFRQEAPKHAYLDVLETIDQLDRERMLQTGVVIQEADRIGTFLQKDHSVVHCSVAQEGLEVLSTEEAIERYDWLNEYRWKMLPRDLDEFTAYAQTRTRHGYFIRALPGARATHPLQACLYIAQDGLVQCVHNIVIVEEGAELNVITGCVSAGGVRTGLHIGLSEFYVKKNATLTFTMIHNWGDKMNVQPRGATVVEEGGLFLQNFVCLHPVGQLEMNPAIYLAGSGAVTRSNTILVAPPGSWMDVGSRVYLQAPETRAEVVARTITTGGDVINRGHLVGEVAGVKAHLECHGLLLTSQGVIHAIPELEARTEGAEMSHEAAVGKIAPEEIEYLMARGLDEDEARATIVRGFLNVKMEGLPSELQARIDEAVRQSQESVL
ncbi:MAG: SufD family Fe-S cluster assembly protein [Candidatus Desulforudis sp.]|nr:SufD family Fe-S cluster assembly protein [Desulforudis sp.]